jgi:hypothetical protein
MSECVDELHLEECSLPAGQRFDRLAPISTAVSLLLWKDALEKGADVIIFLAEGSQRADIGDGYLFCLFRHYLLGKGAAWQSAFNGKK